MRSSWIEPSASGPASARLKEKARFTQWRATLGGGAVVRRVRLSSLESNVAPIVMNVEVIPAARAFDDFNAPVGERPLEEGSNRLADHRRSC